MRMKGLCMKCEHGGVCRCFPREFNDRVNRGEEDCRMFSNNGKFSDEWRYERCGSCLHLSSIENPSGADSGSRLCGKIHAFRSVNGVTCPEYLPCTEKQD